MEVEGGGAHGSEEMVQMEEAVQLLVEHLVLPLVPRGRVVDREKALSAETQEAVARQVHATVLLYNYYHRKLFPQLEFASPDRFSMVASLTACNENLLMYLNHAQSSLGSGLGARQSVTDKAIIDACNIAEALHASLDTSEMIMWPISKVAILLLNRTKKACLLERDSQTKGVWSIFEKDIETILLGGSLGTDMPVQGSSKQFMALPSQAYVLQQIAYSEVELKTGINRTSLHFIKEHRVYSLSRKGTATMLYLLEYDQTLNRKTEEMPLDVVIKRMSGPLFEYSPCLMTTSVVDSYHLLPYKEVLLNIMNRNWPLGSSQMEDDDMKEQKANINSKKVSTDVLNSKKSKQVVKANGDNETNICSNRKNKIHSNANCKRKSEAFNTEVATYAEDEDCQRPTKDFQDGIGMDMNKKDSNSKSRNVPQDIIPITDVAPVTDDHALNTQKEKVTEHSDCITGNMNVQRYLTLKLLQKMRNDTRREHYVLGDRSDQYEMDMQTILTETKMTPKVISILKKYENSCKMMEAANPISSGEGCQIMNIQRKKLKEAILQRNNCQELDHLSCESNWILPRYNTLPSVTSDMYQTSVHLAGPDFNMTEDGDMKATPHEARDSAASKMLFRLQQKAREG